VSSEREWSFRIGHIIEAIEKISRYTHGMSYEQFSADERTVDAVIRNFLVIGEATRHVPPEVRHSTTNVPWKLMEGMRHVLVHDYDSIKLDTIWKTIVEDLPPLIEPLRRLSSPER